MSVVHAVLVVLAALAMLAMVGAIGCDRAPGYAAVRAPERSPERTLDFAALYDTNCAGCHGPGGSGGAALALANPTYLAIADDQVVRRATAEGIRGTAMPAFARGAGGSLTDDQIDAIVSGIRRWRNHSASAGAAAAAAGSASASVDASASVSVPISIMFQLAASSTPSGDARRGAAVFETFCARCHGADGRGGSSASSIVDPAYLALVSDRGLRTTVIAGRPELGAPDWRGNLPGRPMTADEIADVVGWLSSQRPPTAGLSSGASAGASSGSRP